MKAKYTFFYKFARILVRFYIKPKFDYKYQKAGKLPDNYIVLSNHVSDFDPIFLGMAFPRQMFFVASEHIARWPKAYKVLKFAFSPILRSKGASAASAIMDILRKTKKGENVCIFAEGARSWDGRSNPISPNTAKLVKRADCGLVTFKLTGGYFVSPMWGGTSVRKGPIRGSVVNTYSREQLAEMSQDQVNEHICRDLYEDAYERQLASPQKYTGDKLAERLESLLFICPKCSGKDTFASSGSSVVCKECGHSFTYDEYGMLHGTDFTTVREFSDWQKEKVVEHVKSNTVYCAEEVVLMSVAKHKNEFVCSGKFEMCTDHLSCGDFKMDIAGISYLAMHGQYNIVFSAGDSYYDLSFAKKENALRFFLYYNAYKKTAIDS